MNQARLGARIRLKAARRVYGSRSAGVGPLDLGLEPGAFCAVVGPSGCGKSTLLRLLAGLETCSDGAVETDATAPGDVAMVFQSPTLLPWLSARDNVDLPLRLLHRADPAAADAALARVGLADATRLKPAALSGGMAMRVSLARALATQPRLLLLDEPFAALDALTRRALADDLLSVWLDRRPTIVFVTHDVEEAVYLAERVVVLSRGPGQAVATFETGAPAPRPRGWRAEAPFRTTVEAVTDALAQHAGPQR